MTDEENQLFPFDKTLPLGQTFPFANPIPETGGYLPTKEVRRTTSAGRLSGTHV
jgi:hypothetical protein